MDAIGEEGPDAAICGLGDQILDQGTTRVILTPLVLLGARLLGCVFGVHEEFLVDRFLARLKEGESRVVNFGVEQLRNHAIYEAHHLLLILLDVHELRVVDFEDDFHLDPDRQQDHGHDETGKTLAHPRPILHLQLARGLGNRDKELLEVILVEGHLVDVPEDAPVDEVAHQTCQPCNSIALNLVKRHLNVLRGYLRRGIVQRVAEMLLSVWFGAGLALRIAYALLLLLLLLLLLRDRA